MAILVIFTLIAAPVAFGDDDEWDSGWEDDWDSGWDDSWDDDAGFDDDFQDWDSDNGFTDDEDDYWDWDDDDDVWEIVPEILGLNELVTPVTQILIINLENHEKDLNEGDVLTWEVTPDADSTSIFSTDFDNKILTITPHKIGDAYITLKLTDSTGLSDTKRTHVRIIHPDYDESDDSDAAEKTGTGIFVSSIRINGDSLANDNMIEAFVTIRNSGTEDLDNVNIVMVIQDLAARGTVGGFDLDDGEKVTKRIWLEIDDDAEMTEGTYYTRFTINSDKERRVVHREIDLFVD